MTKLFTTLTDGGFAQEGQFLMLFMVALLLLYLLEGQKATAFKQYAFLMLLVLLCPFTAGLLVKYQTLFYSKDNLWTLLPVTSLLGYGLVVATAKIVSTLSNRYGRWTRTTSRRKESILEFLVLTGFSLVLFLCGTLRFGKVMTEETTGNSLIPKQVSEVLATIETEDSAGVRILAADEVARWARIYDGKLLLPYGRNLYEPDMTAFTYEEYTPEIYFLHSWINGQDCEMDTFEGEAPYQICRKEGYQYLIFKAGAEPDVPENTQIYKLLTETDAYIVYQLEER